MKFILRLVLAAILGFILVTTLLLIVNNRSNALDKPDSNCHKVGNEQATCTLRLDDLDGSYRVKVRIVVNGQPEWVANFKSEATVVAEPIEPVKGE